MEQRGLIVVRGQAADEHRWLEYLEAIACTLAEKCGAIDQAWAETIEPEPVASRKAPDNVGYAL